MYLTWLLRALSVADQRRFINRLQGGGGNIRGLALASATALVLAAGTRAPGADPAESSATAAAAGSMAVPAGTDATRAELLTSVFPLSGDSWQIAIDPKNEGRDGKWYESPRQGARRAAVPGVIQSVFPDGHGVAWYWREFIAPPNPHEQGRSLVRFQAVDYVADVWLNGVWIGRHEDSQEPFTLDATHAVRSGATNLLTVRVLNPTHELIEGIRMEEVAVGRRDYPRPRDNAYNTGGIIDSVDLLVAPVVRVEDLHVIPDWKTGDVRVVLKLRNAGPNQVAGRLRLTIAPANRGGSVATVALTEPLAVGDTRTEAVLHVPSHRQWELNDPYLYRASACIQREGSPPVDECSVRFGFRDFCFQDDYFRLNGRRIRLHGVLYTVLQYPVTQTVPHDEDLLRRDMLNMKALGFNIVRIHCGAALPARQLDMTDELGLLVCEEHFGARELQPSPWMEQRWDGSISGVIKRDRNHPSIVIWSLLNEVSDGRVFRNAVRALQLVRELDPTRLVLLNSGEFYRPGEFYPLPGLQFWRGSESPEPLICHNPQDHAVTLLNNTWQPGQLSLHPGPHGEFCVVRWTCPESGDYSLAATFTGICLQTTTTDTHVLHNGKSLHDGLINIHGHGNTDAFEHKLTLAKDDTLDFAVGFGNGNFAGDTTALAATIRPVSGNPCQAAAEFSSKANPNGAWTYGFFAPGPVPNSAKFKLFTEPEIPSGTSLGNLSNPGSRKWDTHLRDIHPYQNSPHTADIIRHMRNLDGGGPIFLSEFGVCGAQDYLRFLRHFEQLGQESAADAQLYREKCDQFMTDWQRFRLDECWARPEDFFAQSQQTQAKLALGDFNAWMSNPRIIGSFNSTQINDAWFHGCGLTSYFRELKPGMADVFTDLASRVRWCLFVDHGNCYRGATVRLEGALVNLDAMKPGKYPARLQVVGPKMTRVFDKPITVVIPPKEDKPEPPFVQAVFSENVRIDGPGGKYRFLATFEHGAAAGGGDIAFYVTDAAEMPPVAGEVVLWGEDRELANWLSEHGIRVRNSLAPDQTGRELILASGKPVPPGGMAVFSELARRMARVGQQWSFSRTKSWPMSVLMVDHQGRCGGRLWPGRPGVHWATP